MSSSDRMDAGTAPEEPVIFTIGHSNHELDRFTHLLCSHGVSQVADVRRFPHSRRFPQFDIRALREGLLAVDVRYRRFEGLGGRREPGTDSRHTALRGFWRSYADHMDTEEFTSALDQLRTWARSAPTAIMCAERDPEHCHRRLLADALVRDGFTVTHILSSDGATPHLLTSTARLEDRTLTYDGGAIILPFAPTDPTD